MKRIFIFCIVLMTLACTNSNTLTIVKNNMSNYQIVVDNNDTLSLKAAKILQDYITKSTGTVISISGTKNDKTEIIKLLIDSDKKGDDYIAYGLEQNNVYIKANNSKYLVYAVYDFLESQLNCKFYMPDCEVIPKTGDIELSKDLKYEYHPQIKTRTVNSRLFFDNHAFADKHKVTYSPFPYYVNNAGVHTFHKFVPADVYFAEHPEYYALVNGKRQTTQLCLSNNDIYKIVVKEVAKRFSAQTDASVISVSQDDNTQYCRCEKCSKVDKEEGSPSGILIRFVNKVAKNFPDKIISTLAYQHTRKACKTRPDSNVLITLCSIECDRSAPIEEKCADFAKDLKDWQKITDNIRIWDYTTQFTNFLAPFPNIHTLAPNIRLFANNNAKWVFEQHSYNPSDLFEIRSYVTARLLWNPNLKTNELISDFSDAYYQEASKEIQEYISLITSNIKLDKDFFLFLYGGPSQAFDSFLSPKNLDKYNDIFNKAESKVKNKPKILARVQMARLGLIYANLEACRAFLSEKYSLSNFNFVQVELDKFVKICKKERVTWLNESNFSLDNYTRLYQQNLSRTKKNNLASHKKVKLLSKAKKYANEDPKTLTDGALGGSSFYANWLGFEGNDMVAIVDLNKEQKVTDISVNYLQVINHLVFLPTQVDFYISTNDTDFKKIITVYNPKPLTKSSKNNDSHIFAANCQPTLARYIKIHAHNMKTPPDWHHGTGMGAWIFADEIIVEGQ